MERCGFHAQVDQRGSENEGSESSGRQTHARCKDKVVYVKRWVG